jgi:serine/threonine-protein phosphatase 2A regulatory subunit B'
MYFLFADVLLEVTVEGREELFVQKLQQCHVIFDFNDASSELKGKQIKAQTLHEMLEYITTQRGIITESLYPEVVKMVTQSRSFAVLLLRHFSVW